MFIQVLKSIILGIVEGVTEWLPVSSTGHMLIVDEFMHLDVSAEFKEMFFILIQFGAVAAVILLFWRRMLPLEFNKGIKLKKQTVSLWFKVAVACIPGAVVTLFFDDVIEKYLHTPQVIASALLFYGFAFILVELKTKERSVKTQSLEEVSYTQALAIGLFQVLSIIPGTSRSGATIIGALIIGVSRVAAAEFTFFLAVPVMLGMSSIKLIDFGFSFSSAELVVLAAGMLTSFAVSLAVVRFLIGYVGKKDFRLFGYYRIVLGVIILVLFGVQYL